MKVLVEPLKHMQIFVLDHRDNCKLAIYMAQNTAGQMYCQGFQKGYLFSPTVILFLLNFVVEF